MKKGIFCLIMLLLVLTVSGCGKEMPQGDCVCVVELAKLPSEFMMLDENVKKQLSISLDLQNIHTEKEISLTLWAEDNFCTEVKLLPGIYHISYSSVEEQSLLPMEVEPEQDTIEVVKGEENSIQLKITNPAQVSEWVKNSYPLGDVLAEEPFSHNIQFEGKMMDVKQIMEYGNFTCEDKIKPHKKKTLTGDKGVTITVLNESEEARSWQECEPVSVTFTQNNVVWGRGAFIGMDVIKAVHAKDGLYGMPSGMSGTVLAGTDYHYTNVSWIDSESGDKLTLVINPQGTYISAITYEFRVFE